MAAVASTGAGAPAPSPPVSRKNSLSDRGSGGGANFQVPLHYPKFSREEYEEMLEWQVDRLLAEYGLSSGGGVDSKRRLAMGTFLWLRPGSVAGTM